MDDDRGHRLAQLLSVIEMNLAFVVEHASRQGSDVDNALNEAREANRKVGEWIRARGTGSRK